MSMAIPNSKDYGAYPDLIFHYAAPRAKYLYASPHKASVGSASALRGLTPLSDDLSTRTRGVIRSRVRHTPGSKQESFDF
jgi:hypothetical protein